MTTRREFAKGVLIGGAALIACPGLIFGDHADPISLLNDDSSRAWDQLPEILARIKPPVFPDRDFLITKFGAAGNNATDCTDAFRRAIDACHAAGGGRVVV